MLGFFNLVFTFLVVYVKILSGKLHWGVSKLYSSSSIVPDVREKFVSISEQLSLLSLGCAVVVVVITVNIWRCKEGSRVIKILSLAMVLLCCLVSLASM